MDKIFPLELTYIICGKLSINLKFNCYLKKQNKTKK